MDCGDIKMQEAKTRPQYNYTCQSRHMAWVSSLLEYGSCHALDIALFSRRTLAHDFLVWYTSQAAGTPYQDIGKAQAKAVEYRTRASHANGIVSEME